jgi:hypothetical protein
MRGEVLETSTTRMTLRQKAFMDSHLWIARFGCDAFLGNIWERYAGAMSVTSWAKQSEIAVGSISC